MMMMMMMTMMTDKLYRLFQNNLMNHKFGQNEKTKINDDVCFFVTQN